MPVGGEAGDPRQVVAALHGRLQENPDGYEENRDLALYLAGLRGYEITAQPYVEKALSFARRDADRETLLNHLAVSHVLKGETASALATYESLHRDYPANPFYAFHVGEAMFRLGRIDEASGILRRAGELRAHRARAACKRAGEPPTRLLYPHTVPCTSFGEMAYKLDPFLKARALGHVDDEEAVLIAPEKAVVNRSLLDCFAPHLRVVSGPEDIADAETRFDDAWLVLDYPLVQRLWEAEERAPLLSLEADVVERGRAALADLGVPHDAWFVCLHVREPAFFDEDVAWNHNRYRNADIGTFGPAIEAIAERGGWVVRLGTGDFEPLAPMENVVDYAMSAARSDWMDVFCLSQCRFVLAGESGPIFVSNAFGVPLVAINWFPPGIWPLSRQDIFVPKRLHLAAEGRDLSVAEAIQVPFFGMPFPDLYDSRGIEVIDSTPEDLRDAVVEMLDRLDGGLVYSPEDEALQQAFRRRADLYGGGVPSRIAAAYLRRHPELLADPAPGG